MCGAKMIFESKNGKTYYPVRFIPPKEIRCHNCEKDMVRGPYILPMNPEIYQYSCECPAKARISATDTIEHWPEEIQKEYKNRMTKWFEDGCPVKEEIGKVVRNTLGIARIKID